MPVKVDFDRFRFEKAVYSGPDDGWANDRRSASRQACEFIRVGNDIVRELKRVGWDVPAVDVSIDHYGRGRNVVRSCNRVEFDVADGEGSKERLTIHYSLGSGQKGGFNLVGTASAVKIGDKEARLFNDGSGDWRDSEKWKAAIPHMVGMLEHLRSLPSKPGHDDETPEGDLNLRQLCSSAPQPVHDSIPSKLYVWIRAEDLYAAYNGTRSYEGDYALEHEHVLPGSDYRMVVTGPLKFSQIPEAAWNGGNYATEANKPAYRGLSFMPASDGLPVEVTLKDLNDVHVYDFAPYHHGREAAALDAERTGDKEWKPGELEELQLSSLRTLVPASEYRGGYKMPVFMIARQLHADEARPMRGPLFARLRDGKAEAVMVDEASGQEVYLYDGSREGYAPVGHMIRAVDDVRRAARVIGGKVQVDPEIEKQIAIHRARLRDEYKDDPVMRMAL